MLLPTVHAAAATSPVIDNTIATQISIMRRACWRSKANSTRSMPANWRDLSWWLVGEAGQSRGSRVS